MVLIYDLENLFEDPDYHLEEYFEPMIFRIDIKAETDKKEHPEYAERINRQRERLLQDIKDIKEECKRSFTDGVFNEETEEIRHFMSTFDSKKENSQQKLEENINLMKSIILRFQSYHLAVESDNFKYVKIKVNRIKTVIYARAIPKVYRLFKVL